MRLYPYLARISSTLHDGLDREGCHAGSGVAERNTVSSSRGGVEVEEAEASHYLRHTTGTGHVFVGLGVEGVGLELGVFGVQDVSLASLESGLSGCTSQLSWSHVCSSWGGKFINRRVWLFSFIF